MTRGQTVLLAVVGGVLFVCTTAAFPPALVLWSTVGVCLLILVAKNGKLRR